MIPQITLRRALSDPQLLGGVLGGPSWLAWRVMLLASMGEKLEPEELDAFRRLTGRAAPPPGRCEEFWGVIGRRGGKSTAMAALACYLAGLCDHRDVLSAGERGVVLCIAPDQRQARIALGYAEGILESTPLLRQLIVSRTADQLELSTGAVIEVRSASFRRLRGVTCLAVIADEAAYWMSDEFSQNPDKEILDAVRPSLATTGGPLIVISSPYARRGSVWETFSRHYGPDGDAAILVAQGASRDFNPSLAQSVIDRAYERDPASAAAEYGGLFRTDIESLITIESIRACILSDATERLPAARWKYHAFCDPSGGSSDSMTLAIAHKEGDSTSILDVVREHRPPFSPEAVCDEYAELCKRYRISRIVSDRYGGEWVREQFRKRGVNVEYSEHSKSEIFLDMLPLINGRALDLLKNERLVQQLVGLERRTTRGGRDTVDHPPGGHDDLANSCAGALTLAHAGRGSGWRPQVVHESSLGYSILTKKYRAGGG